MTAPRSLRRNTKKVLAERGPSIHDGKRMVARRMGGTQRSPSPHHVTTAMMAGLLESGRGRVQHGDGFRKVLNPSYGLVITGTRREHFATPLTSKSGIYTPKRLAFRYQNTFRL